MLFIANSSHFLFDMCTVYILYQDVFCCLMIQIFLICIFNLPRTFTMLFPLALSCCWLIWPPVRALHYCAFVLYRSMHSNKYAFVLYGMLSTLVCICFILYTQYIGVYLFYTRFDYCFCLQFTAWVYNPFWSPISIGVSNALGITVSAYILPWQWLLRLLFISLVTIYSKCIVSVW